MGAWLELSRNTNPAIARTMREKIAEKSVMYQFVNIIKVTEEIVEQAKPVSNGQQDTGHLWSRYNPWSAL
jgi:hypothetical protein